MVYLRSGTAPSLCDQEKARVLTLLRGTSNIEVVHLVPYINELNPLQNFTFIDSLTSLNVVSLSGTSQSFVTSNTTSLNATAAYIQSLDAVNFQGAIYAKNYSTFNAAVAAATASEILYRLTNLSCSKHSAGAVHLAFTRMLSHASRFI
jgi:hypothetical protein